MIDEKKQITLGAIISYATLGLSILITLFYTPWMVEKIGKANYGLYTLAISLIGMFMMDFGLSSAVSRFVSKYRAENNIEAINKFVSSVFKLYFIIDFLILVVLSVVFLLIERIYVSLTPEELSLFKVIYLIVSGFNLISFPMTPLSGILNAYQKFVPLKICDCINKLLTVVLVIIALTFDLGVVAVVSCNAISGIIAIIAKIVIVKRNVPVSLHLQKLEKTMVVDIFSFSVWTTVIGIGNRLIYNLAPSILAITCGAIATSLYAPASAIGSYYYSIAVAINGLFLPTISKYISDKKEDNILILMIKVGRYQAFLLGLILVGFFCVGDIFIVLWMGADFQESYICTVFILIPAFFEYSQQIANTTIVAKNFVKYQAILLIVTGIIGAGLSFLFSYLWGATGICISLCLIGLVNVAGLNTIHKKMGIAVSAFYKKCYLSMIAPIVGTAVTCRIIFSLFGSTTVLWLIIKSGIVLVLYLALMWLVSLTVEEKNMLIRLTKKILPPKA